MKKYSEKIKLSGTFFDDLGQINLLFLAVKNFLDGILEYRLRMEYTYLKRKHCNDYQLE